MKIEEGKTYLTRDGQQVTVGFASKWPYKASNRHDLDPQGRFYGPHEESPHDIVAEVEQGVDHELTVRVPAGTIVTVEYTHDNEDPDDTIKRHKVEAVDGRPDDDYREFAQNLAAPS